MQIRQKKEKNNVRRDQTYKKVVEEESKVSSHAKQPYPQQPILPQLHHLPSTPGGGNNKTYLCKLARSHSISCAHWAIIKSEREISRKLVFWQGQPPRHPLHPLLLWTTTRRRRRGPSVQCKCCWCCSCCSTYLAGYQTLKQTDRQTRKRNK